MFIFFFYSLYCLYFKSIIIRKNLIAITYNVNKPKVRNTLVIKYDQNDRNLKIITLHW